MPQLDPRLITPLRKIAELALTRTAPEAYDPVLDLFHLREVLRRSKDQVAAFLRAEVERLTRGQQTVRAVERQALRRSGGMGAVHCVLCPAGTPEGTVERLSTGMYAFVVTGSARGYYAAAT